ncbi:hypothetical protein [Flavobacterium ranwuense]|uniref:hypothetical protein n=1 Tax=Flavobacterium ranwuense TaxID=2541725 RepID=UPI001F24CECF|nr:hypothetical protein [Flavobacterium ranwuense]
MRSIGMALLAISGSIIAAPVALPVAVVSVAGYAALAGGVISVISQITVDDKTNRERAITNRLKKDNQNLPRDGIK